jgi:hypothetical protein
MRRIDAAGVLLLCPGPVPADTEGNARRHLPGLPAPPCRLRDAGSHRRNMLGWQTRMVEPRGKIEGMKRAEKKST